MAVIYNAPTRVLLMRSMAMLLQTRADMPDGSLSIFCPTVLKGIDAR
jgi:hypothetical protein